MVSILLIAELSAPQAIANTIDNISKQTHNDIEVIIGIDPSYDLSLLDTILEKYTHLFQIHIVQGIGLELLDKTFLQSTGDYVFYKTVGNENFITLWTPRHIEAILSNITSKDYYGFSMIEYRNVELLNQPFQSLWWRIDDFIKSVPKPNLFVLDEVWHKRDEKPDYTGLIKDNQFSPNRFGILFKNKKLKTPKEITVVVYSTPQFLNTLLNSQPNQQPIQVQQPVLGDNEILI